MGKASNIRPSKPLLTGFANNNNNIKSIRTYRRGVFASLSAVIVFVLLGFQSNNLYATEVRAEHCKERRYDAREYRQSRKKQQRQQKKKHRYEKKQHRQSVKQKFKTPNRQVPVKVKVPDVVQNIDKPNVQTPRNNKTVIKLDDNTKLKVKHKGDKTKLVVVKKKNNSKHHRHHDNRKPNKTVIHFDEGGLIGYRVNKNPKVVLDKPLPKNGFVKKLESHYGNLEKVRIKEKHNKVRIVGIFRDGHKVPNQNVPESPQRPKAKPNTIVEQPLPIVSAKPKIPSGTENIPVDVQQPAMIEPSVSEKPVVPTVTQNTIQEAANHQTTPVTEQVTQASGTIEPTVQVNNAIPSVSVAPPSPNVNNVQPRTLAAQPNPIIQSSNSNNVQQNNIQISINQPIVGRSDPEQPINSLNLGGPTSLPQAQQPVAPTLFNARIAQEGESLENEASDGQKMPYHQVAYVDVNSLSQKHHLFGSIGTGIGMKMGQCEQVEGCATSLDQAELDSLQESLETKINNLQQQLSETSSEKKRARITRTLVHVNNKLDMVEQYQNVSVAYVDTELTTTESQIDDSTATSTPIIKLNQLADNNQYNLINLDMSVFDDLDEEITDD